MNPLPSPGEPPYLIAEKPPVFPCWVWTCSRNPEAADDKGRWHRLTGPLPRARDWPFYYWMPDQPEKPTRGPREAPTTRPPSGPAEETQGGDPKTLLVDIETGAAWHKAARERARERALPWIKEGTDKVGPMSSTDLIQALYSHEIDALRHAPQSTPAQERGELRGKRFSFSVDFAGEKDAGLHPFNDVIHIIVESGETGGAEIEFIEQMQQHLTEWNDMATVTYLGSSLLASTPATDAGGELPDGKGGWKKTALKYRDEAKQAKQLFERHTKAVGDFLNELYALMVDPLAEGTKEVSEIRAELLAAARDMRDRIAARPSGEPGDTGGRTD